MVVIDNLETIQHVIPHPLCSRVRGGVKNVFLFGKFSQMCEPTEIWVKKGDFRGDGGSGPCLEKLSKKNRLP